MRSIGLTGIAAGFFVLPAFIFNANAQIAVSANDGKATLVDGTTTVPENPAPDTVMLIDLGASPPRWSRRSRPRPVLPGRHRAPPFLLTEHLRS